MRFLVTGGLGFVGGVTAGLLVERGHEALVIDCADDPLLTPAGVEIENVRIGSSRAAVVAKKFRPTAVLHFAAIAAVGPCEGAPGPAAHNNICEIASLLSTFDTPPKVVNSSSSSVYGHGKENPVTEDHPLNPISWYGWTKLAVEALLPRLVRVHVSLRYGNVAGSAYRVVERVSGQRLIPAILNAAARKTPFLLNGTDYPTPDGTCVRDYVHVLDVAEAHIASALRLVEKNEAFGPLNVGTGIGASVRDVVLAAEQVTGIKVEIREGPSRPGDAAAFVASTERIRQTLGWEAKQTLKDCVQDAWEAMKGGRA